MRKYLQNEGKIMMNNIYRRILNENILKRVIDEVKKVNVTISPAYLKKIERMVGKDLKNKVKI